MITLVIFASIRCRDFGVFNWTATAMFLDHRAVPVDEAQNSSLPATLLP